MDESAYRAARGNANPQPCVFEKALAAGYATCALSVRRALAERETIGCTSPPAQANCTTLAALTRERSTFALRLPPGAPLPHATTMRLLCGGLSGLRQCVNADEPDVARLVAAARAKYGSLVELPWPDMVVAVMAWHGRRPHSGRPA
jgi:hypothetical protein